MRGFRSTLILLVIFVGLLGYVFYFGSKKPADQDQAGPKPKVFTVQADKIEELQVKAAAGDRTTLKKVNGAWTIVSPANVKADETEATSISTNLASLERQKVVDDNPGDIAQYGLATPRVEIAFRKAGDKDLTRLLIGEKTATGSDLYAKLPAEKAVFLVSGFLDGTFNRSTFDLRDKKVLTFDREKVTGFEVVSKDGPVSLAMSGTKWALAKPVAARADLSAVDGAIGRVQTAQMKSITAAEVAEKDLGKYGLDKPDVTVSIISGDARSTLAIGKAAEGGNLYARDLARPMVFTVEAALATDLKKKADEYRPKDLFEFKPFTATRIDIVRGAVTVAYERVKAKDGTEKWSQAAPAKDVDQAKMDTLLSSLSSITVDKWADAKTKTGIESPVVTVAVKFDGGKKDEKVSFGKAGSDVFAARRDDSGAAQIASTRLDEFLKALDALK